MEKIWISRCFCFFASFFSLWSLIELLFSLFSLFPFPISSFFRAQFGQRGKIVFFTPLPGHDVCSPWSLGGRHLARWSRAFSARALGWILRHDRLLLVQINHGRRVPANYLDTSPLLDSSRTVHICWINCNPFCKVRSFHLFVGHQLV